MGFTLLSFIVALGVLVFVHELGHFAVAKWVGVKVLRFSIGFGPILFSWRRGETEYAVSAIPMGGYVKMLGEGEDDPDAALEPERSFMNHRRRSAIVAAGPAMNFLFAFVAYAVLYAVSGVAMPSTAPRVGAITPGMPAEQAGLRAGDVIVAIDDRPVQSWEELSGSVVDSKGQRLRLTVERDGQQIPIEVTPVPKENRSIYGESLGDVYRIGVENSLEWQQVSLPEAIGMAAMQTWEVSRTVATGLLKTLQGRVPLEGLAGPIGIAQVAGKQARAGLRDFISMLAFLSVNLAVLNLLPIPMLDGGHLAFFGIEALLRRPLHQRHREIAQQVGLLLLISLMVFVFYNDIQRLVTQGWQG